MAAAASNDIIQNVVQTVAHEMEKAIDDEIERLDHLNEDDYMELRRKRIAEMRNEAQQREKWKRDGHGDLFEIVDEKEFFEMVKRTTRVVALFVRPANRFADELREHLKIIAKHHLETRFLILNSEKCPFIVDRLKIWMIPSMVLITNQKTHHVRVHFFFFNTSLILSPLN
jgi:hypothetical protein